MPVGGAPFFAAPPAGGGAFLRVTAGALPDDIEPVAQALASAAAGPEPAVTPGPHTLTARWA